MSAWTVGLQNRGTWQRTARRWAHCMNVMCAHAWRTPLSMRQRPLSRHTFAQVSPVVMYFLCTQLTRQSRRLSLLRKTPMHPHLGLSVRAGGCAVPAATRAHGGRPRVHPRCAHHVQLSAELPAKAQQRCAKEAAHSAIVGNTCSCETAFSIACAWSFRQQSAWHQVSSGPCQLPPCDRQQDS